MTNTFKDYLKGCKANYTTPSKCLANKPRKPKTKRNRVSPWYGGVGGNSNDTVSIGGTGDGGGAE